MLRRAALVLVATAGWRGAAADDAQAQARAVLEGPLRFLLRLRGWQVREFTHESDLFSTWGRVVLVRPSGTLSGARAEALRAARAVGMRPGASPDGAGTPDLAADGVAPDSPELALWRSVGRSPPTRYSARMWFSADGTRIVGLWRVDGE